MFFIVKLYLFYNTFKLSTSCCCIVSNLRVDLSPRAKRYFVYFLSPILKVTQIGWESFQNNIQCVGTFRLVFFDSHRLFLYSYIFLLHYRDKYGFLLMCSFSIYAEKDPKLVSVFSKQENHYQTVMPALGIDWAGGVVQGDPIHLPNIL